MMCTWSTITIRRSILERVEGVDFIVVPFKGMTALAHVMISFQIAKPDGTRDHLAVSVETRKERDENYNPVKGSTNAYELMYVVADERDVIQYRTNYNNEDVYLYHTVATPEASKALLGRCVDAGESGGEAAGVLRHADEQLHVEHRAACEPDQAEPDRGRLPRAVAGVLRCFGVR